MKVSLTPSWELSNEHGASFYGLPVLIHRRTGVVYGRNDLITPCPSFGPTAAWQAVERMAGMRSFTLPEERLIRVFVHGSSAAA